MRRGEHMKRKKHTILLIALILAIDIAAGSTLAFLVTQTKSIKNTFNHSNVACEVVEDTFINFQSEEKTNVKVQNTGDTESYIRAAILVNWKDKEGNVYAVAPEEGVDYEIELGANTWFLGNDGFYYYTKPVSPVLPLDTTDVLINRCYPTGNGLEGYGLSVEIVASAIQSQPAKAVENSWHVNVNSDGTISE